ncbi:MAG: DUF402 domain-containing protein [Armatimonadota bacterium]|nr:DUF402 domain-containing protein [Armatimonadota bacterium]MDR7402639.1 DUF402 domain-containing protein [Armatimonadota bacterium]
MSPAVIREVKVLPDGRRDEYACRLLDRSPTYAAVLYRSTAPRRVGPLRLPRGTLTYGYFWEGRPYTVYHWIAPDGRPLGYYVNIAADVRILPGEVRWRDLALDLLFSPDGQSVQVLDADEAARLPAPLRDRAEAGRALVLTHRDEILKEVAALTAFLRGRARQESAPRARTLIGSSSPRRHHRSDPSTQRRRARGER